MHSTNSMHVSHAGEDAMTRRDTALVLRDWGQRHLEATCVMHVSESVFRH
jgi:hypothetical protein